MDSMDSIDLFFEDFCVACASSRRKPSNDRAPSEYAEWPEEKRWALKTLDAARSQLVDMQVAR